MQMAETELMKTKPTTYWLWASGALLSGVMMAVAQSCGQNLARSAMPPETIAGMAAAKVARKKNLTRS